MGTSMARKLCSAAGTGGPHPPLRRPAPYDPYCCPWADTGGASSPHPHSLTPLPVAPPEGPGAGASPRRAGGTYGHHGASIRCDRRPAACGRRPSKEEDPCGTGNLGSCGHAPCHVQVYTRGQRRRGRLLPQPRPHDLYIDPGRHGGPRTRRPPPVQPRGSELGNPSAGWGPPPAPAIDPACPLSRHPSLVDLLRKRGGEGGWA